MQKENVLIVGYGFSGRRFLQIFEYLKYNLSYDMSIAICDLITPSSINETYLYFNQIDRALEFCPTIIVIAVNEEFHSGIFLQIENYLRTNKQVIVLSEKPLTTNLEEAKRLAFLSEAFFSMNLVERYSEMCTEFFKWRDDNPHLKVVRVDSNWGKCRLNDDRPTMGVLSEFIHPLDIILHLFAPREVEIIKAFGIKSDFSVHQGRIFDSVDVLLKMDHFPCSIRSSFVWANRTRTVSIILRDSERKLYIANLEFDYPKWDCDLLSIRYGIDYDSDEKHRNIFTRSVTNANYPTEVMGVYKVLKFVTSTIKSFRNNQYDGRLVNYKDAFTLQGYLNQIGDMLHIGNSHYSHSFHEILNTLSEN